MLEKANKKLFLKKNKEIYCFFYFNTHPAYQKDHFCLNDDCSCHPDVSEEAGFIHGYY